MLGIIRKGVAKLNDWLNRAEAKSPDNLTYLEQEIASWRASPKRLGQITGERYYQGDQDILHRKRTAIGEGGELTEIINLPNNRVVDNQYSKMADQKANYLVGKPITFQTGQENDPYLQELKQIFNKDFHRKLKSVALDALNGAIGYFYPYISEEGEFKLKRFPPYEILPFWKDSDHTELDCFLRLYEDWEYRKREKRSIERVDVFTRQGMRRYLLDGDRLVPDPKQPGGAYLEAYGKPMNWERIPLVPFKYNSQEIPLIKRVKSLQDGINMMLSDFENNMQEDGRNTILVLKNYDGQDLGEFRRNLNTYGAVKIETLDGGEGGVEALQIQVNAENYKLILELLKKSLIENARGYDAKDERMSGSPNQMNIQSMYSDIDLDANGMETEWQAAFEQLLWFVNTYLSNTGRGSFDGREVTVIFNRDILINESEAIENCQKSKGVISDRTIVSQHPWSDDQEFQRVQEQQKMEQEEYQPFGSMGTGPSKNLAQAAGKAGGDGSE